MKSQMNPKSRFLLVFLSLLLIFSVLSACLPGKQSGLSCSINTLADRVKSLITPQKTGKTAQNVEQPAAYPPPPPLVTGKINAGTPEEVAVKNIGPAGGELVVNKPGNPLDGLTVEVPAGAYTGERMFKISSAVINSTTFQHIDPVSPLIIIENGGGYAMKPMIVKVPVEIPQGYFAMGFYYNSPQGTLEGIPPVSEDAKSITLITHHFSAFMVSKIPDVELKGSFYSHFKPGMDDWQFPGNGSYYGKGQSAGQSISSLWYFMEKRVKEGRPPLYGLYDNNGAPNKKTPSLWQDDSQGYRLTCVIDEDWWGLFNVGEFGKQPDLAHKAFAYSIMTSKMPQLGCLLGRFAATVVVYAVTEDGIYIADPTYPGIERKVGFINGAFTEYYTSPESSKYGAEGSEMQKGYKFDEVRYFGQSALIYWDKLPEHWSTIEQKKAGDGKFPAYSLNVKNAEGKWVPLTGGHVSSRQELWISPPYKAGSTSEAWNYAIYRGTEKLTPNANGSIELQPGLNDIGVYVFAGDPKFGYIDFKRFTILFNSLSISPSTLVGKLNSTYDFRAEGMPPPASSHYEWFVDGQRKSETGNTVQVKNAPAGDHVIAVRLIDDSTGKSIGDATAQLKIERPEEPVTSSGDIPKICASIKYLQFVLNIYHLCMQVEKDMQHYDYLVNNWKPTDRTVLGVQYMPVVWTGNTFSAKYSGRPTLGQGAGNDKCKYDVTVSGTVSKDGKKIEKLSLRMNYTWTASNGDTRQYWEIDFAGLPLDDISGRPGEEMYQLDYRIAATSQPASYVTHVKSWSEGPPVSYWADPPAKDARGNTIKKMNSGHYECLKYVWPTGGTDTSYYPIWFMMKVRQY